MEWTEELNNRLIGSPIALSKFIDECERALILVESIPAAEVWGETEQDRMNRIESIRFRIQFLRAKQAQSDVLQLEKRNEYIAFLQGFTREMIDKVVFLKGNILLLDRVPEFARDLYEGLVNHKTEYFLDHLTPIELPQFISQAQELYRKTEEVVGDFPDDLDRSCDRVEGALDAALNDAGYRADEDTSQNPFGAAYYDILIYVVEHMKELLRLY